MFRICPKNKSVILEKICKRLHSKNTESNYKSYQIFQQRYKHYQQSSIFPSFLGISAFAVFSAGLSYHYNENVRESLRPYISKNTKIFLDEYFGPNNMKHIKMKYEDIPWFNFWPTSFTNPLKSEAEPKPMLTNTSVVVKPPHTSNDSAKVSVEKDADRIKRLNEDLADRLAAQVDQLEAYSTNAVLQLMEYGNKIEHHSNKLRLAIDHDGTTVPNPWEEVTATNQLLHTAKLHSDAEMKKFESAIAKLTSTIAEGRKSPDLEANPSLASSEQAINDCRYRLQQKQAAVERAQFNAQITNQYKELIQQGRERFRQELASLSPAVSNWTRKRSETLSADDLNALIVHAHRRMHQLQARIAEMESSEVVRLEAALRDQVTEDEAQAAREVARELQRQHEAFQLQRQSDKEAHVAVHDAELKRALTRQAAAHSEHIAELLRAQQALVEKEQDLVVREALVTERGRLRAVVEGWRQRVEGLEAAVEGRADAELQAREAQDLWIACHALHGVLSSTGANSVAIDNDGNVTNGEVAFGGVTPPLERYLLSFQEACQPASLPVVRAFIDTVPKCARDDGVCTARLLTRRFDSVKTTCRRVAMIDETGASLAMYAVSWMRSLFMLTPSRLIEAHTEIDPVDDVIDTHLIVASAEQAVCRQDIDLAVRLLNLLHGMPRAVAHDWINDARVYLETKLAADALSSYTNSKTAGTIPPIGAGAQLEA